MMKLCCAIDIGHSWYASHNGHEGPRILPEGTHGNIQIQVEGQWTYRIPSQMRLLSTQSVLDFIIR